MNAQTIKLLFGAVAVAGVAIGGYYATRKYLPVVRNRITQWLSDDRHKIRKKVIDWLHKNNLNRTALSKLVFVLDNFASVSNKILGKVYAETEEIGEVKISNETISLDELQNIDPDVAQQVINKLRQEEINIMDQVM